MKNYLLFVFFIAFGVTVQAQEVNLDLFASGFSSSLDLQHAGDERLFVVEQGGVIKILNPDGTTNATPFLDISSIVNSGGERGLLGLAFHPDYQNNGYFFVHYSDSSGDTQISRFTVDSGNPDIASIGSELPIINVSQPQSNHNGGSIAFGPDGYLYIALGDGGGGNDVDNNAQNTLLLLGKMLRIDVDNPSGGNEYGIPADNPFVGNPDVLDEIWAIGLRNPFRFSIDFTDERIWIGDVGQNAREEVNSESIIDGGLNYGWRCYEGNINTPGVPTGDCLPASEYTFPVYDYNWNGGGSVVGGRVYRGSIYTDLMGIYIFGDIDGMLGTLDASYNFINQSSGNPSGTWVAFGADVSGEMYAVSLSGNIYKISGGSIASIDDFTNNSFKLYPNPSNDRVTLSSEVEPITSYVIYDLKGQSLLSESLINTTSKNIDISALSRGVYLVKIISEAGKTVNKKLIIK